MRPLVAGLVVLAMAGAAGAQSFSLPVSVGGIEGAACATRGTVGGAVPVHVGPGNNYEVYDQLKPGDAVFLCERAGRDWYGIVYGKADCGVGQQIPQRQIYVGECRTGWVSTRAVTAAAQ